jgi:peptidoglycan/LPS O-acetylase OafA/YrhL
LIGVAWRGLYFVSDASYSLYLFHGAAMTAFRTDALPLTTWITQWPWLFVAVLVALSIAVASLAYVAIERPLIRGLRVIALEFDPKHAFGKPGKPEICPSAID